MSRIVSLVVCSCVVVGACTGRGKATSDTTAAQAGDVAATTALPAHQSLANLAGTWRGQTLAVDRDSVIATWTFVSSADTGTVIFANGTKVPVQNIRVVGDSIFFKMAPAKSTNPAHHGQIVAQDVVSQVHGDTLVGVVTTHLAAKPDSVMSRARILGTRVKS